MVSLVDGSRSGPKIIQKSSLLTLIIGALIVFVLFDSSQVTTIE
jgi:hypothetical protein